MPYKLSERLYQDEPEKARKKKKKNQSVNLGALALICLIFSLISFMTSQYYGAKTEKVVHASFQPTPTSNRAETKLLVNKYNESYEITVMASLELQSYSFVEAQVLDANKEYLFSFGEELWYEQGRDSDGYWKEGNHGYSMDITFPKPGSYYLLFDVEKTPKTPKVLTVKVAKKRGSSVPHAALSLICLLLGLLLNEIKNQTILRILGD